MTAPARPIVLAVLVATVLALLAGPADARRTRRGRGRPGKPLNMPPGWVWPPSRAMLAEGERCLASLDVLGVPWERGKATRKIVTPVVVPALELGGVRLVSRRGRRAGLVMDCHLAEAFAAHAGHALRELGVAEVRFTSMHRYGHLPGTRILSRHATGLGLDVTSFVTDDGVEHDVARDYATDPLLRQIEERLFATGAFRRPLTPGNDPRRHDDHFHLEARTAVERNGRARPNT